MTKRLSLLVSLSALFVFLVFSSCIGPTPTLQEGEIGPTPTLQEEEGGHETQGYPLMQDGNIFIYAVGIDEYYYVIKDRERILAEGRKTKSHPIIEWVGDRIIRLKLLQGMGSNSLQYFDLRNDRISESFHIMNSSADYIDIRTGEYLLARIDPVRYVLIITDIFGDQGVCIEIDRGFYSTWCNRIVFLNESEIYVDSVVFSDGFSKEDAIAGRPFETEQNREVFRFR